MRQTSIDAYHQIKKEGLLSKLRFVVYEALIQGGPMTAHETWHYLRDLAARRGEARINGITPRFSELERLGVIREKTKRPCKITGRMVTEWETTENLPLPKIVKPTRIKCSYCSGRGFVEQGRLV